MAEPVADADKGAACEQAVAAIAEPEASALQTFEPTTFAPKTFEPKTFAPKPKRKKAAATPAQLVTRVTRAIERELEEIEGIVGGPPGEADKRTRTLASLARTLAEVTKLREAAKDAAGARKANTAKANGNDDALPRDLDEFRRTLERRLAQLVDAGAIGPDRDDERD